MGLRFRHTFFAADLLSEVVLYSSAVSLLNLHPLLLIHVILVTSQVTQGLSELVITIILVAIGSGWTLTNDIDVMGNAVSEGSASSTDGQFTASTLFTL